MKNLFICALVVKLLLLTSVEKANAFSTAPFEEPGGGTSFFASFGGGSDFEYDDREVFFEPDRSGSLQRQTAFGQIRNFFQTSLSLARSGVNCEDANLFPDINAWFDCCEYHLWMPQYNCDPNNPPDFIVDGLLPINNGLPFLIALALLHFAIVYFRRKQRIA